MKKIIYLLVGVAAAFTLTIGSAGVSKETQMSAEDVTQYSHGHTGG
ncbi:hypothetical protein ACO11K_004006 [Bacillus cytotoxicus]|nr:hypothetical protein [Bacillus cereus group sp. BfR-BA-01492]EMA6344553.1 hypothetical protein [Bacillus cytotoxicus]